MLTTARWENNTLMVKWFGGPDEDAAATIENRNGVFRMVFEGYDETMIKTYTSMPTAEDAIRSIINWQNEY